MTLSRSSISNGLVRWRANPDSLSIEPAIQKLLRGVPGCPMNYESEIDQFEIRAKLARERLAVVAHCGESTAALRSRISECGNDDVPVRARTHDDSLTSSNSICFDRVWRTVHVRCRSTWCMEPVYAHLRESLPLTEWQQPLHNCPGAKTRTS